MASVKPRGVEPNMTAVCTQQVPGVHSGARVEDGVTVVELWTGASAAALRIALRLTNERFAEKLGTALRTVTKWNADGDVVPSAELQRRLDKLLLAAPPETQDRFELLLAGRGQAPAAVPVSASTQRNEAVGLQLVHDSHAQDTLTWLDRAAGWPDGEAQVRVTNLLNQVDTRVWRDAALARTLIGRTELADALDRIYPPIGEFRQFRVRCDGQAASAGILTRPGWLDLRLVLGEGSDRLDVVTGPRRPFMLDDQAAQAALRRVAESIAIGTRLVNQPLYHLRRIDVSADQFTGALGVTDFLTYALTADLMQNELLDALATGQDFDAMPMRRRYLADVAAVPDLDSRICAGGALALFAAARPSRRGRAGQDDYMFLVQQRSSRTANAAGRLAVIPKAFHQPLVDFSDDAQVSATLERELEEELFGRDDVDLAGHGARQAEPLHLSRLSPPMRWLIERAGTDAWQIECTGFGLNLMSGGYEFACLVVIHDEAWWTEFGGSIEANWEVEGLRRYSTRDRARVADLVHDASWSNEGLFAFTLGLRRLAEIGGARVDLPTITWEM